MHPKVYIYIYIYLGRRYEILHEVSVHSQVSAVYLENERKHAQDETKQRIGDE